jgi:DNA-binding HxlR family transcriptional regulator
MASSQSYGQYCPLAMFAELLCKRWTVLIIRELLSGSTGFNEINRGVPLISRTLLSKRLTELVNIGLVSRTDAGKGVKTNYRPTEAGQALGPVLRTMAVWGQEWIDVSPSVENVDIGYLMWDVRRYATHIDQLPTSFVVKFHFYDAPLKSQNSWLILARDDVDVCHIDPGHDVDVYIESDLAMFVKIWMGWQDLTQAVNSGHIQVDGAQKYTRLASKWLGLSPLAGIKKQPREKRVYREH